MKLEVMVPTIIESLKPRMDVDKMVRTDVTADNKTTRTVDLTHYG